MLDTINMLVEQARHLGAMSRQFRVFGGPLFPFAVWHRYEVAAILLLSVADILAIELLGKPRGVK